MEAGKNSIIYMGLISGPNKADDTCGPTTVTGTMDRGFTVFTDNDVNTVFNNFLNTYLRIFYSSFPLKKISCRSFTKAWLTTGIKTSCINKRKLFLIPEIVMILIY
jgi:hypothetical protein